MSALETQVGGSHYKSLKIQPVEAWLANDLGPVEASCLKYLTRWREKGGVEDLRKVQHFIEILLEHVERTGTPLRRQNLMITARQYCEANGVGDAEQEIIDYLFRWRDSGIRMLRAAGTCIEYLIATESLPVQ